MWSGERDWKFWLSIFNWFVFLLVAHSRLTLCDPMDYNPAGSSVHGYSPGTNTGVGCHVLLQGNLPDPRIEPESPLLRVDSLLIDPPGKPLNIEDLFLSFWATSLCLTGSRLTHLITSDSHLFWWSILNIAECVYSKLCNCVPLMYRKLTPFGKDRYFCF